MYLALQEMIHAFDASQLSPKPTDMAAVSAIQHIENDGHIGDKLFNVTIVDKTLVCRFGSVVEEIDLSNLAGRYFLEVVLKDKVLTFFLDGVYLKEFRLEHLDPAAEKTVVWAVAVMRTKDEAFIVSEYEISHPENTKSLVPGKGLFR